MKNKHRWHFLHKISNFYGISMRILPKSMRFKVALWLSKKFSPLIKFTKAYQEQKSYMFDGSEEIALAFLLNAMTNAGTTFDPIITVTGASKLEEAINTNQGVLMTGVHGQLHILIVRYLIDKGYLPMVVNVKDSYAVAGTNRIIKAIKPVKNFFVTTRGLLRERKLVMALIDSNRPIKGRTIPFHTAKGVSYITDPLIKTAVALPAVVIFFKVFLRNGQVVIHIGAPRLTSSLTSEDVLKEFFIFYRP